MPTLRTLLRPHFLWPALLLVIAVLYVWGLGGPYVPTNGDEMVYVHIARMTAESGHWLPLQSELAGMRNTKPPLLIWQAMVAGDWGQHWNMLALRLPSIAYSFATAALLAFFTWRLSGKRRTAFLAAVLYLLYFSTFRYGRAYLTSAPETFWLALPMWWLLWLRVRDYAPGAALTALTSKPANLGWLTYSLFGLAMGLGAAYKSFALLAPAGAALWCAIVWSEPRLHWKMVLHTTAGVAWSALLGLGLFSLWFVLDPDPAAVWQEFVLGENAGKMSNTMGYWQAALSGPYPMWKQLLAYPVNAGLLLFTSLGFCWLVLRRGVLLRTYARLTPAQCVLVAWLLVWLIVFTLPSQRSDRYVIPAVPAMAIGMALVWQQIGRVWSIATLLLLAPALVILARIGWVIGEMDIGSAWWTGLTLLAAGLGLLAVFLGLFNARWTRNASLVACAAVYASFGLMVEPLSQPTAGFPLAVQAQLQGKRVAVPNGFTGQFEKYRWALDGARIVPFDTDGRNRGELYPEMPAPERLQRLLTEFDAVVWRQEDAAETQPTCMQAATNTGCNLLAARWHVRSRHKSGEVTLDNLWYPQQWLFSREWLLAKAPS